MAFTDMQGARVRLQLVKPAGVAPLHALLQEPQWYRGLAFADAPSRDTLERLLRDGALVAWEIYVGKASACAGYFGFARHLGTAFVFNVYPDADVQVLTDCCLTTVPALFASPTEAKLLMHVNRDLHAKARPLLLAAGFTEVKEGDAVWPGGEFTTYALSRAKFLRQGDLRAKLA